MPVRSVQSMRRRPVESQTQRRSASLTLPMPLPQVKAIEGTAILGKMAGAVGSYNAHVVACPDVDWSALAGRCGRG